MLMPKELNIAALIELVMREKRKAARKLVLVNMAFNQPRAHGLPIVKSRLPVLP